MIIEVPHFASLRGDEREIAVLRSDDGQSWREHVAPATEDAVHEMLENHFEGTSVSEFYDLLATESLRGPRNRCQGSPGHKRRLRGWSVGGFRLRFAVSR